MASVKKSSGELDRKLSKELDESFPVSDPPAVTNPGGGVTGAEVGLRDESHLNKIRNRAYAIWLEEGRCHGRDREHWLRAEREIDGEK